VTRLKLLENCHRLTPRCRMGRPFSSPEACGSGHVGSAAMSLTLVPRPLATRS
jgi:hypothetical protein